MSTESFVNGQSDPPAIVVENLGHAFKSHRALMNVNFKVDRQALHGFVGPNGAGKTTTLKLICTLLKPQAGRVSVFGHSVRTEVKEIRKRIGFMPDHFSMYRQMTVFEYLDFFGAAYGLGQTARDNIIKDVLALTDMDGRQDNLVSSLSRGMQQRVSLARVLINDPDLLLLDEPASGLDPRARIELMEILQELRRMGKTIFISSHILSELAELCDSVTIIDRGTVKYSGAMDSLLDVNTDTPTWNIRLGGDQAGLVDAISAIEGVADVTPIEGRPEFKVETTGRLSANAFLQELMKLDRPIIGFNEDRKHLNQAFMDLTERGVRT
ncbi:ABC transporter ATP-binding protein [bacterium]|nr:ABC transporter ATP-binding protein [bacterium]